VEAALSLGLEKSAHGIALKIDSPDILHKSDVGGVLLNLRNTEAVSLGYQQIIKNAQAAFPEASIHGVFVQPMIPPGQEVIMGVVRDARFGPLMMFGSGGVEVEGLKDVAFALAPLSRQEAEFLLENTWAGRKLKGFRNMPAADRKAVVEALARLAQLAMDFSEIAEIEVNPLRALPLGQRACALDVRARISLPNA
jgi:acetyltransferase